MRCKNCYWEPPVEHGFCRRCLACLPYRAPGSRFERLTAPWWYRGIVRIIDRIGGS